MSISFTVTSEDLSFFFGEVLPHLDERQRRIITGVTARTLGHGGVKAVAMASGLSLSTVQNGARAVDTGIEPSDRVRAPGAGRKLAEESMPGLVDALDDLVEPGSRGDPECALRWTTKSTRNLADELTERGFVVTHSVVAKLLAAMGYSVQAARKSAEGSDHPDRDAQFRYLTGLVEQFRTAGEPVISVDAKKKELIGNFATAGRGWRPGSRWRQLRTTSPIRNWVKLFRMACMTWPGTPGGCLWVVVRIRPSSRWPRFVGGGPRWARRRIPRQADY